MLVNTHDHSTTIASNVIDFTKYLQKAAPPKYTNQVRNIPVQPIVGDDIQKVKDYILNRPQRYTTLDFNLRDYTIFLFGINVGLRIGDLLHLKIKDVLSNGKIVDYIAIQEQKTRNTNCARELPLVPGVQIALANYINSMEGYNPDWYLFHAVWPTRTPYTSMTRQNIWHKMKSLEKELDSKVPFGTHSLRKTFARALYDHLIQVDPTALSLVQNILGHKSSDITLKYIGITRERNYDARLSVGTI